MEPPISPSYNFLSKDEEEKEENKGKEEEEDG
jgi:hypothetical protein